LPTSSCRDFTELLRPMDRNGYRPEDKSSSIRGTSTIEVPQHQRAYHGIRYRNVSRRFSLNRKGVLYSDLNHCSGRFHCRMHHAFARMKRRQIGIRRLDLEARVSFPYCLIVDHIAYHKRFIQWSSVLVCVLYSKASPSVLP